MSDDDQEPRDSFEDAMKALADEIRQRLESASQTDPDELARAAGLDPDQVRDWVSGAGDWLRSQFASAGGGFPSTGGAPAPGEPAPRRSDDLFGDAGPDPLDIPTADQGAALAALDSGRWTVEPGTSALSAHGDGPGPHDALGLVRELRVRDWIGADGSVTMVGRHALSRWLERRG